MARFTLPVLGMAGAIAVLGAGAFGDLTAWRTDLPGMMAHFNDAAPAAGRPAPLPVEATMAASSPVPVLAQTPASTPATAPAAIPTPSPAAIPTPSPAATITPEPVTNPATTSTPTVAPSPAPAAGETRRDVQDPRAQIAKEAAELQTLRATAEQARRDLALLQEQRQREQAARERLEQANTSRPTQIERPPVATPSQPVSLTRAETGARAAPAVTVAAPAEPADPANQARAASAGVPLAQNPGVMKYLMEASAALAAGSNQKARRSLSLARAQIRLHPGGAGTQDAAAQTARLVDDAIALLNRGDPKGALRGINLLLTPPDNGISDAARRNYRDLNDGG